MDQWYGLPEVVTGIDVDGNLVKTGSTADVIRDDTEKLQNLCAQAALRYGVDRVACSWTEEGLLDDETQVGSVLGKLTTGPDLSWEVQAPYTRITQDWERGTTTYECMPVIPVIEPMP
jgi:hypothetical protein